MDYLMDHYDRDKWTHEVLMCLFLMVVGIVILPKVVFCSFANEEFVIPFILFWIPMIILLGSFVI